MQRRRGGARSCHVRRLDAYAGCVRHRPLVVQTEIASSYSNLNIKYNTYSNMGISSGDILWGDPLGTSFGDILWGHTLGISFGDMLWGHPLGISFGDIGDILWGHPLGCSLGTSLGDILWGYPLGMCRLLVWVVGLGVGVACWCGCWCGLLV